MYILSTVHLLMLFAKTFKCLYKIVEQTSYNSMTKLFGEFIQIIYHFLAEWWQSRTLRWAHSCPRCCWSWPGTGKHSLSRGHLWPVTYLAHTEWQLATLPFLSLVIRLCIPESDHRTLGLGAGPTPDELKYRLGSVLLAFQAVQVDLHLQNITITECLQLFFLLYINVLLRKELSIRHY